MFKPKPKTGDLWLARVRYWPEDKTRLLIVKLYYVWADGRIQFVPAYCDCPEPIWSDCCFSFKLLKKVTDQWM